MSKLHLLSPAKKSAVKATQRRPANRVSTHAQMSQVRQHVALDMILQWLNTQLQKSSGSGEERIIQW
jgi:hypothetical protein